MLSLNVPFLPEPSHVDFLADLGARLYSVHFSLQDPALSDARVRMQHLTPQTISRACNSPNNIIWPTAAFNPLMFTKKVMACSESYKE